MTAAMADAATVGVTVFAASDDALATDGETDGALHVDYPASDPGVVGCGGTLLRADGGDVADETVWKRNGGGTGGGVSALFDLPAYQADAGVPVPEGADGIAVRISGHRWASESWARSPLTRRALRPSIERCGPLRGFSLSAVCSSIEYEPADNPGARARSRTFRTTPASRVRAAAAA